jgi:hypothetical protein
MPQPLSDLGPLPEAPDTAPMTVLLSQRDLLQLAQNRISQALALPATKRQPFVLEASRLMDDAAQLRARRIVIGGDR